MFIRLSYKRISFYSYGILIEIYLPRSFLRFLLLSIYKCGINSYLYICNPSFSSDYYSEEESSLHTFFSYYYYLLLTKPFKIDSILFKSSIFFLPIFRIAPIDTYPWGEVDTPILTSTILNRDCFMFVMRMF